MYGYYSIIEFFKNKEEKKNMKKHFLKSLLALSVAASMSVTFVPATYAAEVTAFDDSVDEEVSLD